MLFKNAERFTKRLLLQIVLFIFGPLKELHEFKNPLDSIIILAQEKIGDAILLTPLLQNLRRFRPNAQIHVVTYSPVFSFFKNDPNVDRVYQGKNHYLSFFKAIRNRKFDLLFCTKDHPSFTFLYQSRLISARYRVGIDHPFHKGFFNYMLKMDFHQHIIEKNCALLDYVGIPYRKSECRPYLPKDNISDPVNAFIQKIANRGIIGMNLSAGHRDREWSIQKWSQFLQVLQLPVMIFSTSSRLFEKQKLEALYSHVEASPPTSTIYEVGQIIRHLGLLITPDTSLIHIASCFQTPVIGLYGNDPIHINRFYPFLTKSRQLVSSTGKVEDIPVQKVVNAVFDLLDS